MRSIAVSDTGIDFGSASRGRARDRQGVPTRSMKIRRSSGSCPTTRRVSAGCALFRHRAPARVAARGSRVAVDDGHVVGAAMWLAEPWLASPIGQLLSLPGFAGHSVAVCGGRAFVEAAYGVHPCTPVHW